MDWPELISDLRRKGLTQQAIAEKCGVAQATISDLARIPDRQPSFDLGTKLVALRASTPEPAKAA
jgi:transcriptional regulator with XRE-family HTH domain